MSRTKRKPLEYIRFFWRDFNRDTAHLSRAQREGYFQILCAYYDNQGPIHENAAAKASGANSEEWSIERDLIAEFFKINDKGMWIHKRADSELKEVWDQAKKNSRAGVKSGEARRRKIAQNKQMMNTRSANDEHSFNESSTDTEQTLNHVRRSLTTDGFEGVSLSKIQNTQPDRLILDNDTLQIMADREERWSNERDNLQARTNAREFAK